MSPNPQVWNKYHPVCPNDAVLIDRTTKWGNPFSHKRTPLTKFLVDSRAEAVDRYQWWLYFNPELVQAAKKELRGRHLKCSCKPLACHGDILIKVANS